MIWGIIIMNTALEYLNAHTIWNTIKDIYSHRVCRVANIMANSDTAYKVDLKTDRQNVNETRKFQILFDKHLFSVRKTASIEQWNPCSTDAMLQQMNSTEHDTNNTLLVDTTRKSWLNDYRIVSCLYPSYKNDLQEYLQRRTKDSTDNNCRRLCVRTDKCCMGGFWAIGQESITHLSNNFRSSRSGHRAL